MDVNDVRIAFTVLALIAFLGVLAWVGRAHNRAGFEEAARLPFADDTPGAPS
jgi:cytochrome c oxidase cbb3-type subunit 4